MGGTSPLPSATKAFLNTPEAIRNQAPYFPPIGRLPNGREIALHGPHVLFINNQRIDIDVGQRLILWENAQVMERRINYMQHNEAVLARLRFDQGE